MNSITKTFAVLFLAVLAATTAMSQEPPVFENLEQELRFAELTAELRCTVCQNQNLADSDADGIVDGSITMIANLFRARGPFFNFSGTFLGDWLDAGGDVANAGVVMAVISLAAVLGPVLGGFADKYRAHRLVLSLGVLGLALGFVAFSIGSELRLQSLRRLGRGIVWIIFSESMCRWPSSTAAMIVLRPTLR